MTAAARILRLSRHALRHQMQKVGLAAPEQQHLDDDDA